MIIDLLSLDGATTVRQDPKCVARGFWFRWLGGIIYIVGERAGEFGDVSNLGMIETLF